MEEEKKVEEKVEKKITEQLKEKVEEQLKKTFEQGVSINNVDYLYKLIDIHKDIANEEYWKVKEEKYMNYRGYGEDYGEGYGEGYGRRGVPGTGRYRGEYGRRGVKGTGRGRYRGEDAMMEMHEHYGNYSEAYEEAMNGNYGAEGGMVKSVEGIMKNIYEIVDELSEAEVPEVMHIIQKYTRKMQEIK